MSLELGQISFEKGYTPTGQRRRAKRAARQAATASRQPSGAEAAVSTDAGPEADAAPSRLAEVSIRPLSFGPRDVRFLLGASEERFTRSLLASLGSHTVGIAILAVLISLAPERVYEVIRPSREQYSIVWLPEEGPGGGGGGGGNESLEVPREVELQGTDEVELSVPVQEEPDFVEPEIEPEVIETQMMNIPAVSMAAAPQTTSGVLEGLSASASTSQGSGSGGGGGTGEGTGIGPGTGPGLGPGEGGGVGGGVYRPGAGIVNPQLLRNVEPQYTSDALRAKISGTVVLEMVVLPDGTVGEVKVVRSLDSVFGLDQEAVKAAKQWLFKPATRFGEPVALLVNAEVFFNLR